MQNSDSNSTSDGGSCQMAEMNAVTLPALVSVQARQWAVGQEQPQLLSREVSAEVPVAMVFNGISHAVMMASPTDLVEFGVGFAISEGIVDGRDDCRDVEFRVHGAGTPDASCAVHMEIASRHFVRLKEQRRTLAGRTGCGVCGIDSIQALDLHPSRCPRPNGVRSSVWRRSLPRSLRFPPSRRSTRVPVRCMRRVGPGPMARSAL
ncbi:formate dehydrogenase accessory sulfurtransferase FdhD [Diaphorobacter aerolatus]|uniref:formate dehydrogenase accessory sulfurtransferase FdhD n=1 Tax=Diaphorobacter aerolatus TaxID=1288495 RepID=UPI0021F7F10B|nr:formate dehydrogenase accessory sulfurtransferase FdhD [Diaphorobacter aerolatus]